MDEREEIVAWLRDRVNQIDDGEQSDYMAGKAAAADYVLELLDAIEHGDHLSKPEQD
jgi:hypothetical protein